MEHSNEKQHSNDMPAYEACIHDLDQSNQYPQELMNKMKQFGDTFTYQSSKEMNSLGAMMHGTLVALRGTFDESETVAAQQMFIRGAMTGLYLGDEMMSGRMPVGDIFTTGSELVKNNPYQFINDAATIVAEMNPETKQIIDKWKQTVGIDGGNGALFDAGFGVMICSVNKTMYEIDMLHRLDWDLSGIDKSSPIALQSVDDDCLRLAEAFYDHKTALNIDGLSGKELVESLHQINELMERDFVAMEDIKPDDRVQTRDLGICVMLDGQNRPDSVIEVDENLRVRGTVIGLECMIVPTEYALIMGITEGDDIYESQICFILENIEAVNPSGEVESHDNKCAIPLRSSGTHLDKLLFQA